MTETPTTRDQLLHLADRARRGVALPAEHDALHQGITAMAERAKEAEADHARVHERACLLAERLRNAERRAERAKATTERVRAELDRIADLDTVTRDDGRADRFSTGARWTLRMVRENALDEQQSSTTTEAHACCTPGRFSKGTAHTHSCPQSTT